MNLIYTIAGVGLAYGIFTILAGRFMHYPYKFLIKAPKSDLIADYDYDEVEFKGLEGNILRAWFLRAENNPSNKTLLLIPGWGHTRKTFLPHIKFFVDAGYNVFTYDQRSHGASEQAPLTFGEKEGKDFLGAIEHLKTRGDVNMNQLGIMGESLGGGAVLHAIDQTRMIRAIVFEGPWATDECMTFYLLEARFTKWFSVILPKVVAKLIAKTLAQVVHPAFAIGASIWGDGRPNHGYPYKHAHKVAPIPILFIRGENDHMVPEDCAMKLINAAGEPKEIWINKEGKHRHALQTYPEEYKQRVLGFLQKYIVDTENV